MRVLWVSGKLGHGALWIIGFGCLVFFVAVGLGPRTGRYATLTVLSGSMRPGIPEGSIVLITPERPEQVRVGQIITYAVPVGDHHVVSHRVVEIVSGGPYPVIRTQGDANDTPDPWLAQIDGSTAWRVRASVPGLGRLISWLRQPLLHRVSVVVVPVLLAGVWLADIWAPDDDSRSDVAAGIAT